LAFFLFSCLQIIEHARRIQEEIITNNPLLSEASVSISKLHVTLMVFALNTDEDKQRSVQMKTKDQFDDFHVVHRHRLSMVQR